jgi:hypothetical protein
MNNTTRKHTSNRTQCFAYIYEQLVYGKPTPSIKAHCDLVYGIHDDEFDALLSDVKEEIRSASSDIQFERGLALLRLLKTYKLAVLDNQNRNADTAFDEIEKLIGISLPPDQPVNESEYATYWEAQNRGYVYLIQGLNTPYYKIGKTNNLEDRITIFNVKLPMLIEFICVIKAANRHKTESFLHQRFADKRIDGEWFNLGVDDVEYIKELARASHNGSEET